MSPQRRVGARGRGWRLAPLTGVAAAVVMAATIVGTSAGVTAGAVTSGGVPGSTIDICKAGPVTGQFPFSLNGGTPIEVTAGTCVSEPVEDGMNTVTEGVDPTGATMLSSIGISPQLDMVSSSVANRTATVNIPVNQTATLTFTNVQAPHLQVCKIAASSDLIGQTFDFTETGGPSTVGPFGVVAGPSSAPGCGPVTPYAAGTDVTISEAAATNAMVTGISVSNGTLVGQDNGAGLATVTVATTGTTVVTYTNSDIPPGLLVVCKDAADKYVAPGPWSFTVTNSAGKTVGSPSVLVNACSSPISLAPGLYTVTESFSSPDQVSSISASPSGDLVGTPSLSTGTAVFSVSTGATTTATFTNATQMGKIQVCKVAGTSSLVGKSFSFTESALGTTSPAFTVKAGTAASPGCNTSTSYPVGTAVTVTEKTPATDEVTKIVATPGPLVSSNLNTGTAVAKVTSGTTVVTYTNKVIPKGDLVVCKFAADSFVPAGPWSFTITNSAGATVGSPAVLVNACSTPLAVPPGNYTVTETFSSPDQVSAITASPAGDLVGTPSLATGTGVFAVASAKTTTANFTNATQLGKIEVCKVAGDPSLVGETFNFTESALGTTSPSFAVVAGTAASPGCSTPVSYPIGTQVTIEEASTAGVHVSSITVAPGTLVSSDLGTGTSVATVAAGATTVVTYTNAPDPSALIVCKFAADSFVPAGPWSFTITNSAGSSVGTPSVLVNACSSAISLPAGNYTVTESFSSPDEVSSITASPASDLVGTPSLATGSAVFAVNAGATTTANFTNATQMGKIEVCKVAGTANLVGQTFTFTESALGTTSSPFTVVAGTAAAPGCSTPVSYPVGTPVTFVEAATAGDSVSAITVAPGTLVSSELTTGTSVATVAAGTTTAVTYTNIRPPVTGGIKVCKTLANGSGGLAGTLFTFNVSDSAGSQTVTVKAPAVGKTTCVKVPAALTLGSVATITEVAQPNVALVGVRVAPATSDAGSTATTAKVSVGSKVASAIFTNQALGWVEVCKQAANAAGLSWDFTVDGGTPFPVTVGDCSSPLQVPAGTVTIQELESNPNYYLEGVTAINHLGKNALLTGPTADGTITVSVPYGGVPDETVATYTNAVDSSSFKVCTGQTSPGANLAGQLFSYDYSYTVAGVTSSGTVTLTMPTSGSTCSGSIGPIAVVNPDGTPVAISITADNPPVSDVDLTNVLYQGNGTVLSSPTTPSTFPATLSFTLGQGVNIATFTNGRTT